MKDINERIKIAEEKLVAALKKRVSSIDFDYNTYDEIEKLRKWHKEKQYS